jgi:hypothetical protein
MTGILNQIDVNSYDFVGLSERFFVPGKMCEGYFPMIETVFRDYPALAKELGPGPANVRTDHLHETPSL